MKTVIVTVEGGVVQDVQVPAGVKVEVWDFDTDGECNPEFNEIRENELGQQYAYSVYPGEPDPLQESAGELLACLKVFVGPWSKGWNWQSKINYDTFNNARIAIAKAEGRTPA